MTTTALFAGVDFNHEEHQEHEEDLKEENARLCDLFAIFVLFAVRFFSLCDVAHLQELFLDASQNRPTRSEKVT
ncbi:MAG: hypothetical protein M3552_17005 [Planctomycetota bacterium]|nr:hypothetical protein [Planctomycetaceae bacterium]MDQ3332320.1 hypothetical protein [Planctomycetota bacterium]